MKPLLKIHEFFKYKIDPGFPFLVALLVLSNLPFLSDTIRPVHDTMSNYVVFHTYYNEYFTFNKLPLWDPFYLWGMHNTFNMATEITPALSFAAFVGKLFGMEIVLWVYKLGIFLEEFSFLTGIFLLSRRLYRRKQTAVFVGIGSIFSIFVLFQIQMNFHLYYLVPLVMYFIVRFFDDFDFKFFWMAGIVFVLSRPGSVLFFGAVHMFIYIVFFVSMILLKLNECRDHLSLKRLFEPAPIILFAIFSVLAIAYLDFAGRSLEELMIYRGAGRTDSGSLTLEDFLSPASFDLNARIWDQEYGQDLTVLWQYIFASPNSNDLMIFIGLIPVFFLLYAIFLPKRDPRFTAILITAMAMLMLSFLGLTIIAPLAYYVFPGMKFAHYLAYLRGAVKIMLLLASGFGLDHYLGSRKQTQNETESTYNTSLLTGVGLIISNFLILNALASFRQEIDFPFPYKIKYFSGNFPYQYHVFSLLLLVCLLIHLWKSSLVKKVSRLVLVFFLLEMASYHSVLIASFYPFTDGMGPLESPMPKAQEAYQVDRDSIREKYIKDYYGVKRYTYSEKVTKEAVFEKWDQMDLAIGYFGVKHPHFFNQFYVDICPPEMGHSEMWFYSLSLDNLFRSKLGLNFNDTPSWRGNDILNYGYGVPPEKFLPNLGCSIPNANPPITGVSKLRLHTDPFIVNTMKQAKFYIYRYSGFIGEHPIIIDPSAKMVKRVQDMIPETENPSAADSQSEIIGQVKVTNFSANELELVARVEKPEGSWLIYNDNYHPGWKVFVNGNPRPVLRANIAFKGIRLDNGINNVKFVFSGHARNGIYIYLFFALGILFTSALIFSGAFMSLKLGGLLLNRFKRFLALKFNTSLR